MRFLFRSGSSVCLSYGSLGPWEHQPSAGLLVKFTGDLVVLVLIRGSNLDAEIGRAAVNLTDRGMQRQRITWVREMDEDELRRAGEGEPTVDLWAVDVRRFGPHANNRAFLRERVAETLGLHYQMAWPNREFTTGRCLRRGPLHDRLASQGACFGSKDGWERPNWFAREGVEPVTA